jgi:hypothetical protein
MAPGTDHLSLGYDCPLAAAFIGNLLKEKNASRTRAPQGKRGLKN